MKYLIADGTPTAIFLLERILHFAGVFRGFIVWFLDLDGGIQGFIGHIQGFELPILKFTFFTQFQRAENGAFLLLV